jgi:crossover junction endodeoxyribonuclease RuvC
MSAYRILGIDPGTAIVGWAILDVNTSKSSDTPRVVAYGDITTDKACADEDRLHEISNDLASIIESHQPHAAAIEELFFFKNQKTIITVAQARGVIVEKCYSHGLSITGYTPLQIKQSLTGYGRADKAQMQSMITTVLGLHEIPKPDDTADALAVALCHANSYKYTAKTRH